MRSNATPETLDRMLDAAVNNERLARVSAVLGLHRYLRQQSPTLFAAAAGFVAELEDLRIVHLDIGALLWL